MDELLAAVAQYRADHPEWSSRGSAGWPESLRQQVARVIASAPQKWPCLKALRDRLGVSMGTLYRWQAKYGPAADDGGPQALLRPVSIQPQPEAHPGGLTLTAPSGHIVSGLSVQQAAELLLRLS